MELRRGVNLGGWLSQCRPSKEHFASFITRTDFDDIARMGFDHVRVSVDYNVLETEDGQALESGYRHLSDAVSWARDCGLNLIIDLHKAYGYSFGNANLATGSTNTLFKDESCQARFLDLWDSISFRFSDDAHVAFELLNEVVEPDAAEKWNELIRRAVKTIRKNAAEAPIIYGGVLWNSASTVEQLEKPTDANVIFNFHFYEPHLFTHQNVGWDRRLSNIGTVYFPDSTDAYNALSKEFRYASKTGSVDVTYIQALISRAAAAAEKAGVRLYCGEFGVIDHAPAADTLNWFRAVDSVMRAYNIGCALWSYKRMNFGFIDAHYDPIRQDLLKLWTGKGD